MKHRRQFPGATAYVDRHGRRRWRYRSKGFSAELGADYGSPEFIARYEAALAGSRLDRGASGQRLRPGSISAVIASYYRTPQFLDLASSTQRVYRGILEPFRERYGDKLIATARRRHLQAIVADKAETPSAANNLIKRLRQVFDHAIDLELRADNPAASLRMYSTGSGGFHTWDEGEIARFFEVHALGTLAHTAVSLMLWTGAARVDVVQLGWKNIREGRLEYKRQKTLRSSGQLVSIGLDRVPELVDVIDRLDRSHFTFLQTSRGASRSSNGLGNLMRRWCSEAGLPGCSAHGLRKGCARRLAEAGVTAHEIMSVTGHKTLAEVQRYSAERSRMADSAMEKLHNRLEREQKLANHPGRFAKQALKGNKKDGEW